MEKNPQGRNPGLIWCNSKVTKPNELGSDSFCRWHSDVHIPDELKTGSVSEAFRYTAVDPKEEIFHMALYYVDDVDGLHDKVKSVPHHHQDIPGSQDMFDYGFFDTRFYKSVQVYEHEVQSPEQPNFLVSADMLLASEQEFESRYREEHLVDESKISGWRRTERYELCNALRTEDAPKYLTLLFLDGPSMPIRDLEKAAGSEWSQKIMGGMKKMRISQLRRASLVIHRTQDISYLRCRF